MKTAIARIETFPVHYATAGYFKFFEGPKGRSAGRPSVVVKITADNGVVGWGQCVPSHRWSYETLETVETTIANYLAPELIGLDPFDDAALDAAMKSVVANSFSTGQPICKAGVDLALFDLTGKMLGQSAAQRWKRKGRDKIEAAALDAGVLEKAEDNARETLTDIAMRAGADDVVVEFVDPADDATTTTDRPST